MRQFNFCTECGKRIYPWQKYVATWGNRLCSSCADDLIPNLTPVHLPPTSLSRAAQAADPGTPSPTRRATAGGGEEGTGGNPRR